MKKWMTAAAILAFSASMALAGPPEGATQPEGTATPKAAPAPTAAAAPTPAAAPAVTVTKKERNQGRQAAGDRFAEKLGLTPAQKEQVEAIRKASREENAGLFEASKATRIQFRAAREANDAKKLGELTTTMQTQMDQIRAMREAEKAKILKILTPPQREKFDDLESRRNSRRGKGNGDSKPHA